MNWAKESHQVVYTYLGMRWVFYRLGLKKKVPRPRSPKALAEEQEAWGKGAHRPIAGSRLKWHRWFILE